MTVLVWGLVPTTMIDLGSLLLPLVLGAAAIYLLLPRPRSYPVWWGAGLGTLALVAGAVLMTRPGGILVENILFYAFSVVAIVSGTLLISQHNPARAALSFALVILSTCGLFLLLAAPFLMAATIVVYAGAIVVTFLFVLMLAQQAGLSSADMRSREPLFSVTAGFALLGALLYVLQLNYGTGHFDQMLQRIIEASEQSSAADIDKVVVPRFKLTEASLASLRIAQVPNEVLLKLDSLKDKELDREQLGAELAKTLDKSEQERYQELILNRAQFRAGLLAQLKAELRAHGMKKYVKELEDEIVWPLASDSDEQKRRDLLTGQEKTSLEKIVKEARWDLQRGLPLTQAHGTHPEKMSPFSGPSAAVPMDELRRNAEGVPELPADNAAYLGRSLFTDYLLAVELGGLLLLIAVVGAVAIAHRGSTQEKAT